jgi:hypothetical protein
MSILFVIMFESALISRLTYSRSLILVRQRQHMFTGNVAVYRIGSTRVMALHSTSINSQKFTIINGYQRQWDKEDAPSLSDVSSAY